MRFLCSSLFTRTGSKTKKEKENIRKWKQQLKLNISKEQRQYRQYLNRETRKPYINIHKWLIIWQNGFEWSLYLRSNFLARLSRTKLGKSKQKCDWQCALEIRVRIRVRLRVALFYHFSRRITKTSTLSSANFTDGDILLKERTQTINNEIKLHILGVPMNKLDN